MKNFAIYESDFGLTKIEHENELLTGLKALDSYPNNMGAKNRFQRKGLFST